MNGVLIIDKPAGITSHDVVARCRRILKTKKIGHTGTLDPFATGVMVILVGKATRLAQFLDKDSKEYEATVRFGFETDTGDSTGTAKSGERPIYDLPGLLSSVRAVLPEFTGEILQTPPMFSAKKVEGKKLYELARQGVEIDRRPVPVTIFKLELVSDDAASRALLTVACSAGTYIRTLAEEIAQRAGSAAHLAELRRTRAGKFGIEDAIPLERLERIVAETRLAEYLIPLNAAVDHLPAMTLNAERAEKTKSGLSTQFETDSISNGADLRMVDESGELVAIGTFASDENRVRPRIVLV